MRLKDIRRFNLADHTTHESRSLHVLGITLFLTSILLIPPAILAFIDREPVEPFMWPMLVGLIISIFLTVRYKSPPDMRPSDGIAMIFILWVALFIFGTVPYVMYGIPLVDAIFETVSGFTTVGASVLSNIESYSNSILLWRALTQWIGGMMIVIMFMFIMPMIVSGGRGLMNNEMSGSGPGTMSIKLRSAAQQFIAVYTTLTFVFFIVLLILGQKPFDSAYIAMSTISTGGFMNHADSMTSFSSAVKIAVIFFMILSASNYYLHFRMVLKKDIGVYRRSEEFRAMIAWFVFMSVVAVIGAATHNEWSAFGDNSVFDGVVNIVFSVVSIGTTTGFSVIGNFYDVASIGLTLIIIMMIIGGSSGSTAGGIKISRALILGKAMLNEIRQQVHPNAVYGVRYDRAGLPDSSVRAAMVMVIMFALTVMVSVLVFDIALEWDDAIYTSIAIIAGNGSSQGVVFANYESLPDWLKIFSCFLMFVGRMEIVCVLTLFTKSFWKEYLGIHEIKRIKKRFKGVGTAAVDAGYSVGKIFWRRKGKKPGKPESKGEVKDDKAPEVPPEDKSDA